MMTEKPWCYFGCGDQSGHYLYPQGHAGRTLGYGQPLFEYMTKLDGELAPLLDRVCYRAVVSRLGSIGYSAISWWDKTVDHRGGSNSILFAPSLDITAEQLLAEGRRIFPWVFARLPEPLQVIVVA